MPPALHVEVAGEAHPAVVFGVQLVAHAAAFAQVSPFAHGAGRLELQLPDPSQVARSVWSDPEHEGDEHVVVNG